MDRRLEVALLLLALSSAPAALADDVEEDPTYEETIVVTATRTPVPAEDVGSAVTVIDAEQLDAQGVPLVVDALRRVPGVDVRRTGGPGSATSLFLRGTDSDHTLVLLDGIELNDPSSPNRAAVLGEVTVDGLDRIEVLRGPQSTLYGSDAVGGVIQLFTRRGAGDPRTDVRAGGGSYGTTTVGMSTSGGSDRASWSASASRWATDGFSATSAGTEDDAVRNTTLSTSFGWGGVDASGVDVIARHVDGYVEFDGFDAEDGNFTDSRDTLARVAPRIVSHDGRLVQRFGVEHAQHRRDTTSALPSVIEGRLTGVDWQADLTWAERHTLSAGIDGEWERAELTGFEDDARTLGGWVQDRVSGSRWFGSAGVRHDDHSEFGGATTGRIAGGRKSASGRTVVRGSAGTGYKAPSLTELSTAAFAGNPDLDAETSAGADFGVDQRFVGELAVVHATLFAARIDELIVAVFDPGTGLFRNVNVDEAESYGLELDVELDARGPTSVRASYTWNETEARGTPQAFGLAAGDPLLRRPEHRAGVELAVELPGDRGHAWIGATWVGDRTDVDPVTFSVAEAEAYLVVDATAQIGLTPALRLELRLDNLLDEDYEEVLGYATADRSASAALRYRF
jgi:vitamin B12 transporter